VLERGKISVAPCVTVAFSSVMICPPLLQALIPRVVTIRITTVYAALPNGTCRAPSPVLPDRMYIHSIIVISLKA
jgi:hypothetical protein